MIHQLTSCVVSLSSQEHIFWRRRFVYDFRLITNAERSKLSLRIMPLKDSLCMLVGGVELRPRIVVRYADAGVSGGGGGIQMMSGSYWWVWSIVWCSHDTWFVWHNYYHHHDTYYYNDTQSRNHPGPTNHRTNHPRHRRRLPLQHSPIPKLWDTKCHYGRWWRLCLGIDTWFEWRGEAVWCLDLTFRLTSGGMQSYSFSSIQSGRPPKILVAF